tara:strand:+ start:20 stop:289 length:270 start_codon:yes stop_codon:yes gene_type:complete
MNSRKEIRFSEKGAEMDKTETDLIRQITVIVSKYRDYEIPYLRTDGDIVIPLNPILKKNREAHRRFAEAMRNMMDSDLQLKKKKSKAWV